MRSFSRSVLFSSTNSLLPLLQTTQGTSETQLFYFWPHSELSYGPHADLSRSYSLYFCDATNMSDLPPRWHQQIPSLLLSLSIGLLLLSAGGGALHFWEGAGATLLPGTSQSFFIATILCVAALGASRFGGDKLSINLTILGSTLVFVTFSDWLLRGFSYLQGPLIRGEIFLGALFSYFLVRKLRGGWVVLAPISIAYLLTAFHGTLGGELIFTDDHSTFHYRLTMLRKFFPQIPFYGPLWNGGIDERDFFPTGAINLFLVSAPLYLFGSITAIYNLIVGNLLFGITPLFAFLAARQARLSWEGSAIAAILSVSSSLFWYRWALHFGTLGFLTSTALLPLVFVLGAHLADYTQNVRWYHVTGFIVTFSLMILWTPSGLVLIPLILLGAFRIPRLLRKKFLYVLVPLLLTLHLPWMTLFWSASNVSRFLVSEEQLASGEQVEAEKRITVTESGTDRTSRKDGGKTSNSDGRRYKHSTGWPSLRTALKQYRELSASSNPLILLFGLPGIFLLNASLRLPFLLTAAWLLGLGAFGFQVKPQLELDRMLPILLSLLLIPSATVIEKLFQVVRTPHSSRSTQFVTALTGGYLVAGVLAAATLLSNQGPFRLKTAEAYVFTLPIQIQKFAGRGRTLFTGASLHEFSGGHLALLAALSERPLIASSQVHRFWTYTQVFPPEFIERGDEGIYEYLDLYNVSLVMAHEPTWRKYFRSRSEDFEEVSRIGPYHMFRRKNFDSNYFLEGSGELLGQSANEVHFSMTSAEAVLKFNFVSSLKVTGCDVTPFPVSTSVTFTKISHCNSSSPFVLQALPPHERLLQIMKASPNRAGTLGEAP